MKNKIGKHRFLMLVTLSICLWLCGSLCSIPTAEAFTVWADSFSDGDYNGWTLHRGGFSASGNQLETTGGLNNYISHPSTVAVGTWSFDWHMEMSAESGGGDVFFMTADLNPVLNNFPRSGYSLGAGLGGIGLYRWEGGGRNPMDIYNLPMPIGTFSIDVTRDSDGNINVWVDDVHVMDRQNVLFNTSTHFFYWGFGNGEWLDNIVVSNTVDIDPPAGTTTDPPDETPSTTPGIPGFPMVAIALGLVAAFTITILVRRKK